MANVNKHEQMNISGEKKAICKNQKQIGIEEDFTENDTFEVGMNAKDLEGKDAVHWCCQECSDDFYSCDGKCRLMKGLACFLMGAASLWLSFHFHTGISLLFIA